MDIGIPKEIKSQEGRVALMPDDVASLTKAGHSVKIESSAGLASGADDQDYLNAGALVLNSTKALYSESLLIAKVKEIMPGEFEFIRPDHIIYTNLHTALNRPLTDFLIDHIATPFCA